MNKYTHFFIWLSILFYFDSYSQVPNDSLEYRIRPDNQRNGQLYLSVENFNFLRNYEFYNKFQDGYTLFGTQLAPQLVYYPNSNLVLTGGVLLHKDFGDAGIRKTEPLFSLKYHKNSFTLVTGALEGSVNHRLIEPLYDVEKRITDPVEYGTQAIIESPRLFVDAFIRWKRMIYKPSPEQEQIVAGASADVKLVDKPDVKFSIPLQLTVFHQGGQIDTINKPLQTVMNGAVGFRVLKKSAGFIREWRTENFIAIYDELSPTKLRPFSTGTGLYLNGGLKSRSNALSASYWRGDGFISVNGMPVYQSLSQQINYPGYSEKKRELLFVRYAWQQRLVPNLWLDFRVEPVFDLRAHGKMEFYHSLFLVYRQEFRLVRGTH